MAVKIRLRRTGAKKQASYRLVVADSKSPRDGRFIEILGHFNPRRTPVELVLDEEKTKHWLGLHGCRQAESYRDKSKVPVRKPREKRKGKSNG